jgi:hypothetical protein
MVTIDFQADKKKIELVLMVIVVICLLFVVNSEVLTSGAKAAVWIALLCVLANGGLEFYNSYKESYGGSRSVFDPPFPE